MSRTLRAGFAIVLGALLGASCVYALQRDTLERALDGQLAVQKPDTEYPPIYMIGTVSDMDAAQRFFNITVAEPLLSGEIRTYKLIPAKTIVLQALRFTTQTGQVIGLKEEPGRLADISVGMPIHVNVRRVEGRLIAQSISYNVQP